MSKPYTLITAPTVSEQAQKTLRAGGVEFEFMPFPISEADLLSAFSRRRIDAVLLRGSPPPWPNTRSP